MITDQRVLDNVKKLLDLGMTPEDVKDNLIKMGVSEKDAIDLIQRAGGVISKQKTEEELDEIKELEKQESINFAKPPETPKKESQHKNKQHQANNKLNKKQYQNKLLRRHQNQKKKKYLVMHFLLKNNLKELKKRV